MKPASLIQLTDSLKALYIKTAQKLKGSDRRQFMAEVVKTLGIEGKPLPNENWAGIGEQSAKGWGN